MKLIKNIIKPITNKITTDKDRLEEANKILETTNNLDLEHLKARNNFNIKNPRSWVEIVCVIGFTYTALVVPILNDLMGLNIKGANEILTELLYALLGLGGYRLAEKVVSK